MQNNKTGRTILVGEDELEVRGYLEMALRYMGFSVELAQDGEEVLSFLRSTEAQVAAVLLDIATPDRDGLDTLREIRQLAPDLPVIVISGSAAPLNVVAAMKEGATDFLSKPVVHEDLRGALAKALEALPQETTALNRQTPAGARYAGVSAKMREIYTLAARVGWSEAPVLIQGETGSGKEVLARELHAASPRASKTFLKLNCAALPSELVESELFGYERGAFTGAFQRKAGMFELADGGTILLDEIGDMDVRLQAKLLQVLQDHEFQRLGGKDTIQVDVRVIAATHRDLERAIADRTFREDLYYRLNVITMHLPPLRERREDIVPLAEHLMRRHSPEGQAPPITPDLRHAMNTYGWPGNVRELENFVRKYLILRNADMLARELHAKTSRRILSSTPAQETSVSDDPSTPSPILEQVTKAKQQAEIDAILAALNSTRWNRKQAAAFLRIDYKALLYKMKKLGIDERPTNLEALAAPRRAAAAGIAAF
jgi:two-component system, NtrC family, response regulator AtoC